MENEIRGLMSPRFMLVANTLLYAVIVVQYFVLFSLMRGMAETHRLSFRILLLPLLYPGPLIIALAFKRNLNTLLRKELLTAKALAICNDWVTVLLCLVYGMVLDFRLLH